MRRLNAISEELAVLDPALARGVRRHGQCARRRLGLGAARVRAARQRLIDQYAAEHSQGIASGVPILALDRYEHAYQMDFGANARAYVDTFMRCIDWSGTEARYQDALKVAPPRPLVQPCR